MASKESKAYFSTKVGNLGANPQNPRPFADIQETALDVGETFETSFLDSLGHPSLSSFYKVRLDLAPTNSAGTLEKWLQDCGVYKKDSLGQERFSLMATEAILPGATFATTSESGSRQGIVEKFAAQRTFNDVAVTYYLTGDYRSLTMFQEWINYINPLYVESGFGGGRKPEPASATGYPQDRYISNNSFLRYRYPQSYKRSMTITKFERNIDTTLLRSNSTSFGLGDPDGIQGGNVPEALSYRFVNVFPTSIQDIALSYSDSQVLQVTVNFAYDRYVMVRSSDVIGYTGGTINFPSDDIDDNSEALLESPSNVTNETEATTAK